MRVFIPCYTKDGKTKTVNKWWIELRDHLGVVRRFPGFSFRDEKQSKKAKAQTEALGRQIESLVRSKVSGEQFEPSMVRWLEQIPPKLRNRFINIRLLNDIQASAGQLLSSHLAVFRKSLSGRCSEVHVKVTCSRIKTILDKCGFLYWSEIQGSKVQVYLDGRGFHLKTYNYYLTAFRQFCRWMVADNRATSSPAEHLKRHKDIEDIEYRRALSFDEVVKLLESTDSAPDRFGMSGHERAVLYLMTIETGCRASEIRRLKVSDFNYDDATVTIEGIRNKKNKRTIKQFLKAERVEQLKGFLAGKLDHVLAFNMPDEYHTASMIRADLEDAGIEFMDDEGRRVDHHSLRHILATELDHTRATLKERKVIMRHKTKDVTLVYTHAEKQRLRAIIEQLPPYPWPGTDRAKIKKTGTYD